MLKSPKYVTVIFLSEFNLHYYLSRSWDRVVITIGYGLNGLIPGKGKIFIFPVMSRPTLEPIQPPSQWLPVALSSGLKRPGREADHSPPSRAKIKNG
jgi:hypothetical protein